MGRRVVAGVVAGGLYVWLVRAGFAFLGRMRDQATNEFSGRPLVPGIVVLVGVGLLTALVTILGRRLPSLLWTAGTLSLLLIPQWSYLTAIPAPVRRWVLEGSFGLEGTALLAGLLLGLAVHATWVERSSPS